MFEYLVERSLLLKKINKNENYDEAFEINKGERNIQS